MDSNLRAIDFDAQVKRNRELILALPQPKPESLYRRYWRSAK